MTSPSRVKHELSCIKCGKIMMVRKDYIEKHSGVCVSCQKKGNKNALKHGDYKERLYKIWIGMFHRRYRINPTVCDEWHSYEQFKLWSMQNGYSESMTIDRINPSGKYEPENCQWISFSLNCGKDKRIFTSGNGALVKSKRIEAGMTQVEYAKLLGVSRRTIQRAERGEYNEW